MSKFKLITSKSEQSFTSELNETKEYYSRIEIRGFQTEMAPGKMEINYSCLVECFDEEE